MKGEGSLKKRDKKKRLRRIREAAARNGKVLKASEGKNLDQELKKGYIANRKETERSYRKREPAILEVLGRG
ncbi:MAG: hypothetical protein Q8Q06_03255 [bacterium]|nr:hypothetical protein [bacterium]